MRSRRVKAMLASLLLAATAAVAAYAKEDDDSERPDGRHGIRHVLLISIDGMHALDFANCAKGVSGVNGGQPYCPNLASLATHGANYLDASASKPSDSFPGLMAIVAGGSARSIGAFYDVAYDRSLDPPAKTTANGVAGGTCVAGSAPTGTTTEYDEGIDIDTSKLNGGAPSGDGGINSIDPDRLPRDPANGCKPVYPWNFVRTNTIFGVVHTAGGYTAWSDKHPSYSSVSGPGTGQNLDDYYSPEINSPVVGLPGVTTPTGVSCASIVDSSQTGAWTDSFQNIQCYDTLKTNAILNEIDGKRHDGKPGHVPALFGMNFQAVSVGQKLIEKNVGSGGYVDAMGTPSALLLGQIQFVDAAIGAMSAELAKRGLADSTLIIVTAKHGQSPIDPHRFFPIPGPNGTNGTSPANLIASMLPFSESPANPDGIGPTEDDISLLWLTSSSDTASAVATLEANAAGAGIGQIFVGPALGLLFRPPGLPPAGDPRTPDIVVAPNVGVVYTGSSKKQEEHGGFAHDDVNVMMLLSHPAFHAKTISSPVETAQVAPTILEALGLEPNDLQSVRQEGTQLLPGLDL